MLNYPISRPPPDLHAPSVAVNAPSGAGETVETSQGSRAETSSDGWMDHIRSTRPVRFSSLPPMSVPTDGSISSFCVSGVPRVRRRPALKRVFPSHRLARLRRHRPSRVDVLASPTRTRGAFYCTASSLSTISRFCSTVHLVVVLPRAFAVPRSPRPCLDSAGSAAEFSAFVSAHLPPGSGALCISRGLSGQLDFSSCAWTTQPEDLPQIMEYLRRATADGREMVQEESDDVNEEEFFERQADFISDIEEHIMEETELETLTSVEAVSAPLSLIPLEESSNQPTPGQSQLRTNSELTSYGFKFNMDWGVFVCVHCESGYAIDQVWQHLTTNSYKAMRRRKSDDEYKMQSVPHLPEATDVPSKAKLARSLRATVLSLGYTQELQDASDLMTQWKQLQEDPNPIQGIFTFRNVRGCGHEGCHQIFLNQQTQNDHNTKQHKSQAHPDYKQILAVQTLLSTTGKLWYRKVLGAPLAAPVSQIKPAATTFDDLYAHYLPNQDLNLPLRNIHLHEITDAHRTLGIPEFLDLHGRQNLQALVGLPSGWAAEATSRLQQLQQQTSDTDCEQAKKASIELCQKLMAYTKCVFISNLTVYLNPIQWPSIRWDFYCPTQCQQLSAN
uniref:C2H2-type domain-containing protein n=1 Tax=Mycena chlorophos TaxID=658473 RepID=A0ABQ0LDH2_MYCCL|nr:predicted protein [Mycena chlorophos]